jgi:hypothetical protein
MFKSVRIQNFRQFKDLKLENLAQINLITGKNDTGKTSLLEALSLVVAPQDPGMVSSLARLRGIDRIPVDGSLAWGFIFNDGQIDQPIVMEVEKSDRSTSRLQIRASRDLASSFVADAQSNGSVGQQVLTSASPVTSGLEYEYALKSDGDLHTKVSRVVRVGGGWLVERAEIPNLKPWYFRAHRPADIGQPLGDDALRPHEFEAEAQRFSQLVLRRQKSEVIEAVRVVEPRVTDLEVLDLPPPTVVADIGLNTLVPMTYLGVGFEQILKLIHATLLTAGGVLLIDEIEHGFHYSVLPGVWNAIISAARRYSVQIVATTHSYECIQAAVESSKATSAELAMFRLTRVGGRIRVVDVDDEGLRDALSLGFEMR